MPTACLWWGFYLFIHNNTVTDIVTDTLKTKSKAEHGAV